MFKYLRSDIRAVIDRDPAARSPFEVFLLYPGVHALFWHRVSHALYREKIYFLARLISAIAAFFTRIEIHPGAEIGLGVFIDHGTGVVIGETAVVGDNVTIYQGVTLGGTGKHKGKRHPTIGNNVLIGAGAKVLGPFKVGDNAKVAANAVVLEEVPADSTAVGVPARIVKQGGVRVELDQIHIPDPVAQELCRLQIKIENLQQKIEEMEKKSEDLQYKE